MAKRSIKESLNDAAFAFVKQGFESPDKSNVLSIPKEKSPEQKPEPKNVDSKKPSPTQKKKDTARKPNAKATDRSSDHLVSVSTRMPSSLFAELKKEALTRQLAGQSPNSLQQIMIDAASDWLKKNER